MKNKQKNRTTMKALLIIQMRSIQDFWKLTCQQRWGGNVVPPRCYARGSRNSTWQVLGLMKEKSKDMTPWCDIRLKWNHIPLPSIIPSLRLVLISKNAFTLHLTAVFGCPQLLSLLSPGTPLKVPNIWLRSQVLTNLSAIHYTTLHDEHRKTTFPVTY